MNRIVHGIRRRTQFIVDAVHEKEGGTDVAQLILLKIQVCISISISARKCKRIPYVPVKQKTCLCYIENIVMQNWYFYSHFMVYQICLE